MASVAAAGNCNWLCNGQEVFPAMLSAIEAAKHSVSLESYIYSPGALGQRFLEHLIRARQRQVRVQVLVDALGSFGLPSDYWKPLIEIGGEVRWFNPLSLNRLGFRNHRKLLVCDGTIAFVGGFNIAPEYEGNGINCGWCDLGLRLEGPLVIELSRSFDEMFARAGFRHKRFARLLKSTAKKTLSVPQEQLLMSGPGRGPSPIKQSLSRDLRRANSVKIMVAYFLPSWQLRHQLMNVVRRGGRVQLLLPGKSDVAVSRLAAQSLYLRLLRNGVEIYEYQPQILHAKLFIIDDAVYVGSANLDPRSLNINYELVIRFANRRISEQARGVFEAALNHSQRITTEGWTSEHSVWRRFKQHWSYFLLVRIDPYVAQRQWRWMPD